MWVMENGIDYKGMLVIHGTIFELIKNRWIRELSDSAKLQSLQGLRAEGEYLKGYYNLKDKTIQSHGALTTAGQADIRPIYIPMALKKDGERFRMLYTKMFNAKSRQQQLGVIVVDDETSQRLNGTLPVVELAGNKYLLDLIAGKLKFVGDDSRDISLPERIVQPRYGNDFYIFQPSMKEMVPFDEPRVYRPERLNVVEFPNPIYFDPIGVAKTLNLRASEYLNLFTQQDYVKLKTYSLNDSTLPQKVAKQIAINIRFELSDAAFKPEGPKLKPGSQRGKRLN